MNIIAHSDGGTSSLVSDSLFMLTDESFYIKRIDFQLLFSPSAPCSSSVNRSTCVVLQASPFLLYKSSFKPTIVFLRSFTESQFTVIKLQNACVFQQQKSDKSFALHFCCTGASGSHFLLHCHFVWTEVISFSCQEAGAQAYHNPDEKVQRKRQEARFCSRRDRASRKMGTWGPSFFLMLFFSQYQLLLCHMSLAVLLLFRIMLLTYPKNTEQSPLLKSAALRKCQQCSLLVSVPKCTNRS